ncbi:carbohydrate ABC transporter permease [Anaerofilum sp. BX8]|uniref:Carbohydrate ABC transporter permease n=1 Tax=Anaerofilum hominis TaxID=2763016 RepID=A0A923I8B3_9FIRM|nr:carbohydrate ABC transporter permease [Anaerofilum hominis]MBC5582138.1 carbohydrate ABC transporter permease [Anaerofilum hominis]
MERDTKGLRVLLTVLLLAIAALFIAPVVIVVMNSFKGNLHISSAPFAWPTAESSVGLTNYLTGFVKIGFLRAFGWSLFITVCSVALILLFSGMAAWYLARVKTWYASLLYYLFVFSMIVPFQMVMFPMSKLANLLSLSNPLGILFIYLGFGAGLSIFLFTGFVKSIPLEIEEAATIDGCGPWQTYFLIVLPILKPTSITVAILNAMWVWNDYLLPTLVLGGGYMTLPRAIQGVLTGSYGGRDMGALMAMLVLSILPIIAFYLVCQKYIIRGVVAGAVKG